MTCAAVHTTERPNDLSYRPLALMTVPLCTKQDVKSGRLRAESPRSLKGGSSSDSSSVSSSSGSGSQGPGSWSDSTEYTRPGGGYSEQQQHQQQQEEGAPYYKAGSAGLRSLLAQRGKVDGGACVSCLRLCKLPAVVVVRGSNKSDKSTWLIHFTCVMCA